MGDVFGNDTSSLAQKRLFVFDMDGTIYSDGVLYEGARELFEHLDKANKHFVFFTNNSSRSVEDYVSRIRRLGIHAGEDNFCTSTEAAIACLRKRHEGDLVYCMGTRSFVAGLKQAGIRVTEEVDPGASVVLIGYDTELNYGKVRNTCEALTFAEHYYATNVDYACPTAFGFVPDCGAIAKMIEYASGRQPTFLGKPEPYMVNVAMERFCCSKSETLVVGDRLYTDIASGLNAGVDTLCVLTGEATEEAILNSQTLPTFTLNNVRELLDCLTGCS